MLSKGAWFVNERWIATDPYANVQGLPPDCFVGSSDVSIPSSSIVVYALISETF
jgi:hypothetical protein